MLVLERFASLGIVQHQPERALRLAGAEALRDKEHAPIRPPSSLQPELPPALRDLTSREREVLRLLAQGATDWDIATGLSISVKTVTNHVANILGKLGCANWTAAAAIALQHGLV